jgi:hypothetical protein
MQEQGEADISVFGGQGSAIRKPEPGAVDEGHAAAGTAFALD